MKMPLFFISLFLLLLATSCAMRIVNKSRVLQEAKGFYFFYSRNSMSPIFFPSDKFPNGDSLATLDDKDGYFVNPIHCGEKALRDYASKHDVKILYSQKGDINHKEEDSVYLIPVVIKYTSRKIYDKLYDQVNIYKGDTLIKMRIHQSFTGLVLAVESPIVPKAID
jgi:hypothetical protein